MVTENINLVHMGLEPMTLALLAPRSADWANGPRYECWVSDQNKFYEFVSIN